MSAAVMQVPEGRAEDRFETHFTTNYLGHFLLTCLLLDSLVHSGKDGSCSRVVSISSSAHYAADARLQDLLSILQLKVSPDLEGGGGCCVCAGQRSGPQQRLTMKIFRLDSGETPASCWASRTHSLFNRVPRVSRKLD
ncbi:dehydrogenase/reductase SDR family member on chromosome X-like [Sinocyclocheilus grahami]|uniref:dehydrogenase/reductase SDR family member on chromosome X-like n=1 Tax=Sinocyclocheilus grahami TaxID=75366 RepID=UPI0007AD5C7C|nr:PREDICTED: dehydrogenase/reductase SDR family member on chromosome X-like [Sinocyclocheilus grahami]